MIVSVLASLLTKVLDFAFLGVLNRVLGGVFGVIEAVLILSIFIMIFNTFNEKSHLVER